MSTQAVIPTLDAETFRRELAGLIERHQDDHQPADFGAAAEALAVVLAEQFDRKTLDPFTLWSRVSSAILTSAAKTNDADLDHFLSLALEHVKAEPSRAATSERVLQLFGIFDAPDSWRVGFLKYVVTHHYAVIIHGRNAWKKHKEDEA